MGQDGLERDGGRAWAVIECARGQTARTRLDGAGGVATIRDLPPGVRYPFNYGYLEGTRADDGEELDVFVLGPARPPAGRVEVRVLAGIEFADWRGDDPKLLAEEVGADGQGEGSGAAARARATAAAIEAVADFLRRYKGPSDAVTVGSPLPPGAAVALLARARGGGGAP